MKGITRIDTNKTHGWQVRIYAKGKVICSKLFSDKKCKGYWEALKEAEAYASKCKASLPSERYPMQTRNHKNNKTGIIGVFKRVIKRKDKIVEAWVGHYREAGKVFTKQFSCFHHGFDKAFRLAKEFRRQGVGKLLSKKLKHLEIIQKFEKEIKK